MNKNMIHVRHRVLSMLMFNTEHMNTGNYKDILLPSTLAIGK